MTMKSLSDNISLIKDKDLETKELRLSDKNASKDTQQGDVGRLHEEWSSPHSNQEVALDKHRKCCGAIVATANTECSDESYHQKQLKDKWRNILRSLLKTSVQQST